MAGKKKNKSKVMKPSAKKAKPAKQRMEKSLSRGQTVGSETTSRGFTLSLGGDKSLQAYKNWINGIMSSIKPNSEDTMTEEEWVESWKKFWSKADSVPKSEPKKTNDSSLEDRYPGITEQLRRFEEAELPSCPHCGSDNSASVQVGVIGRTIYLAASTKKFKLVPNMKDKLGKFFCNACGKFFD